MEDTNKQLAMSGDESTDKILALVAHLGPFSAVGFFIIPFLIFFLKKDSAFVTHHAKQAMVYQGLMGVLLSVLGGMGFALTVLTAGLATILVIPFMGLLGLVACFPPLMAAYKTFHGHSYSYPGTGVLAEKL